MTIARTSTPLNDKEFIGEICRAQALCRSRMKKLLEIANSVEAVQDGRIHIEKINGPFLFEHGGKPAEYTAGMKLAIARGFLWMHESKT